MQKMPEVRTPGRGTTQRAKEDDTLEFVKNTLGQDTLGHAGVTHSLEESTTVHQRLMNPAAASVNVAGKPCNLPEVTHAKKGHDTSNTVDRNARGRTLDEEVAILECLKNTHGRDITLGHEEHTLGFVNIALRDDTAKTIDSHLPGQHPGGEL